MKKRIVSLLTACCIVITSFILSPGTFAADTLVLTDHSGMYGAHLLSRTEITKKEDGVFDVTVDMYTYFAMLKENRDVSGSTDDYYVVDRDGKYLVELWGGDGASTDTAKGGFGGYTVGIVSLNKGDVIYYTLGGAGTESATAGKGGGSNGGGNCGPRGSTAVGGGGGYSAAFLYKNGAEAQSFYDSYTDADLHLNKNISNADRLEKYIMIAGGGGGAGSGTGDRSDVAPATGGDGGYEGTASGSLDSANGYAVSGTFFAGKGGSSTDGTGQYAGKGGDYLPGKPVSTVLGWGEGSQPNDWTGTQNKQLIGGAGGDGNYRGGGGGAGFAGGSGGLVSNIALARGVGGGGGGSSFISTVFSPVTDDAKQYAIGRERTEKRANDGDGTLGGYFHIVYVDEADVSYLSNLNVELARTPYFTLTAFEVVNTVEGIPYNYSFADEASNAPDPLREITMTNVPYDMLTNTYGEGIESNLGTLKFNIPNVSLMPDTLTGDERDHLTVKLSFTVKDDFAGGNNVPLFAGSEITVRPADQSEHSQHVTGKVTMKNFCGYVNVPVKLYPAPVNHTPQGLDPANTKHKVSSLFVDRYADVRGLLNSSEVPWQYYFIEDIGYHSVTDEFGNDLPIYEADMVTETTISPDETSRYLISLTARAKAPSGKVYARLGEVTADKLFTGWSVVTIAGSGMEPLGDNMVVYNKALNYDSQTGEYVLGLYLSSDSSGSIQAVDSLPKFNSIAYGGGIDSNGQAVSRVSTVTIPITGYYTLTLKGGNGGQGGAASFSLLGAAGGTGGIGANITATYVLEAGTMLRYYAGKNASNQSEANKGALGGDPSYVAVLDENGDFAYYLMIAAGGPGGGGAGALWSDGANGAQPTGVNASSVKITRESTLSDYTGNTGANGGWGGSGNAGTVKNSYVYSGSDGGVSYQVPNGEDIPPHNLGKPADGAVQGGSGTLVCKGLYTGVSGSAEQLGTYNLEAAISKYFTVTGIALVEVTGGEHSIADVSTVRHADKDHPLADDDENYTYQKLTATVNVEAVPLGTGDVEHLEFTLEIRLKPRSGFLGGNDVKIIEPAMATTGLLTGIKLSLPDSDAYINIDESRSIDYANVPISEDLLDSISVTAQNRTYVYGDTLYMKDLIATDQNGDPLVTLPDLTSYGWRADYLKLLDPTQDTTPISPETTTDYIIKAGVLPIYPDPYSETQDHELFQSIVKSDVSTVYTDFEVFFDLSHIDLSGVEAQNGRYLIPFGPDGEGGYVAKGDYVFYLSTSTGEMGHEHHLPAAITVKVGDRELVNGIDYTYDRGYDTASPGENQSRKAMVKILQDGIRGNVYVTAEACEEHHVLYYVYQLSPDSDASETLAIEHKHYSEHVDPVEDFGSVGREGDIPESTDTHIFMWDYGALEVDNNGHYVMPKGEAWVTGRYLPREFTVTVEYVNADGDAVHEPYVAKHQYGTGYNVPSPAISRYKPDIAAVSGTVNGDVSYKVTYSPALGLLTVHYVYPDGTEASASVSEELNSGEHFSVISPDITGYTPDQGVIEGYMEDDGLSFTVTYSPKHFLVTFVSDGAEIEKRTVVYDNIYSYCYDPNSDSYGYEPFPSPVKLGYTFEGWEYKGALINAADTVSLDGDATFTAKFKAMEFTLVIQYSTNDDPPVEPYTPTVLSVAVGENYNFEVPELLGFTPDRSVISGVMPAQNLIFYVTYTRNSYTLRIVYETPDGVSEYNGSYKYGESYSVASPDVAGYQPNLSVVSGVMGASDVTATVSYYRTAITVDVEWGAMEFNYDRGRWNPEELCYQGGSFVPVDGSNTVKVTNTTKSTNVNVRFEFIPSGVYSAGINGYFTLNANDPDPATNALKEALTVKKNNGTATAYFYLDGADSLGKINVPDAFIPGRCTVIISE